MGIVVNRAQRALYAVDRRLGARARDLRRSLGLTGRMRLQPLDGWITGHEAVVRVRVLESRAERTTSEPSSQGALRKLARRARLLYRRYATAEVPGQLVHVRVGEARVDARSDEEGFVVARLPLGEPRAQTAQVTLAAADATGGAASVSVPLFAAGSDARLLVISDIDDTVLDTELRNPVRRFAQLLLADRPVRLPFDGVGAFYRALAGEDNPIFYVSNSPINLHHHLVTLFQSHALPAGPLLLRRFRAMAYGLLPAGMRHKDVALEMLMRDYPQLPVVLVGDTSRRDSDHYLRAAENCPGRVAAIYIRRAPGPLSVGVNEDALSERADAAGVPLCIADSVSEMAADAHARGLLRATDVSRVEAASDSDATKPEIVESLVQTD